MSRRGVHPVNDTGKRVVVLKSPAYGDPNNNQPLPYRIDQLRNHGYEPVWTDRHLSGTWGRLARETERWSLPWAQAWLTRSERRDAVATVAMFESEGHGLALYRRILRRRQPPLIIIGCWLADLARAGGPRRSLYQWLYKSVDVVVVLSGNQRDTLSELLEIPAARIAVVRFGVDLDELEQVSTSEDGSIVAAGRDLGRDWGTLAQAVHGSGWNVNLFTRSQQVAGLALPEEIELHGTVGRESYLKALAAATVVAIPTYVREYPTGQTVLLEAMALGKACVVTDTPAMREYVEDGVTGLLVPPGNAEAFREAVAVLMTDTVQRRSIGMNARIRSTGSGGAETMWKEISQVIGGLSPRESR